MYPESVNGVYKAAKLSKNLDKQTLINLIVIPAVLSTEQQER